MDPNQLCSGITNMMCLERSVRVIRVNYSDTTSRDTLVIAQASSARLHARITTTYPGTASWTVGYAHQHTIHDIDAVKVLVGDRPRVIYAAPHLNVPQDEHGTWHFNLSLSAALA